MEASNLRKYMIKHDNKCPFLQNTLLYAVGFFFIIHYFTFFLTAIL